MNMKNEIDQFISHEVIAVVGASRNPRKFGNIVLRKLISRNYHVLPVNPNAAVVESLACFPDFKSLPQKPDGAVFIVPPTQTMLMAKEAVELGVNWIWMQPGSESEEAIRFCINHGVSLIHGDCILMFLDNNAFIHRVHRLIKKISGKLYSEE